MRNFNFTLILVFLACSVSAKTAISTAPWFSSEQFRQGGDTVETAVEIDALPFFDSGTTVGSIDLLGSSYDTTLMVYELNGEELIPVECNDDFHPDYTSRIESLQLSSDVTYIIVVSGYNFASGNYVLNVAGETVPVENLSWSGIKSLYR
jgi:hypothetical protein